jgi:NADH-quinone oxidoreductase subunit E
MSVLSADLRQKILDYLPRYPSKQAATLPALHLVQDEMRCVPLEAVREIAGLLDLSPAELNDAMTFYGFFRGEDHKLGKTRLWVCRSLACALRGGDELLTTLCQQLNVRPGGTTSDGAIKLEFAECIGVCEGAPAVLINDEGRPDVTPDKVESLIEELRTRPPVLHPTLATTPARPNPTS